MKDIGWISDNNNSNNNSNNNNNNNTTNYNNSVKNKTAEVTPFDYSAVSESFTQGLEKSAKNINNKKKNNNNKNNNNNNNNNKGANANKRFEPPTKFDPYEDMGER
jgi:hypothetical protein